MIIPTGPLAPFLPTSKPLAPVPTVLQYIFNFQCVSEEEDVTREEVKEEQDFIDAMVDTKVMQLTMEFLASKGLIGMAILVFRVSTKLVRLMAKTEQAQRKIVYILKWNNDKVYLSKIGPIFDNLV